ncbi:hypothetical protein [Gillisia sp. CAL575]|uniref:hypothetical protein n=1 Tax=Gillisia sp. CAL575 TaxID=985255 RepID=UPI000558AEA4|nr:hypothetical protein [Gillisia sp. CAL575]
MHNNNDCFIDETYIFKPEGIVEVTAGMKNCFYGDSEIAASEYRLYEESGLVFIDMVRRKISGDVVSNMVFTLSLMGLDEDRMLFAAGEKGDYGRTLIFESE